MINETQGQILRGDHSFVIASSLEDLLYHRLGKEWNERSYFSSLLEQIQMAETFGRNVQHRLFRALSYRLQTTFDRQGVMQQQLRLLNTLQQNANHQNASSFQNNLNVFLEYLGRIEVQALSSIHAITTTFEYLASYLVFLPGFEYMRETLLNIDLDPDD